MNHLRVAVVPRQRTATGQSSLLFNQRAGRVLKHPFFGKTHGGRAVAVAVACLTMAAGRGVLAGPVIMCPPTVEISCGASTAPEETGFPSVLLNPCGGSVTFSKTDAPLPGECAEGGILRYWVGEACGVKSLGCIQTIRFIDATPPEFQVLPLIDDMVMCGAPIPPPPPVSIFQVVDNCDPNPSVTLTETQTAPGPDGGYMIRRTWTAKDLCGNSSMQSQVLFVNGCLADDIGVEVLPEVSGIRFYDANANGSRDAGEPGIPGWKISLTGGPGQVSLSTLTDAQGRFAFGGLLPGTYALAAAQPLEPGWVNTTATPVLVGQAASESRDLGVLRIGGGAARGIGFWTGNGGQQILSTPGPLAQELALLTDMFLRQADGGSFDPGSYRELKDWLKAAKAINMSHMLSAQLTAAILSRDAGLLEDETVVQAPGTLSANGLGYITLKGLIAEANAELRRHPVTSHGSDAVAFREYQEMLKDAFEAVTANESTVQPIPAAVTFAP